MALFLSRFDNKVDGKGRVSVPAAFRADLTSDVFAGVVAFTSLNTNGAIDACDIGRMQQLSDGINSLNPFSVENRDFGTTIMAGSHKLPFDTAGRILLPEKLLRHAGITNIATFAGLGATFQIWAPEAYEAYEIEATERARDQAAQFELQRRDNLGAGE